MSSIPPIIVSVPKSDNDVEQQGLPGLLSQVPPTLHNESRPTNQAPSFQERLALGQKYERHLAGYLLSQQCHVILLSPGFDILDNAPCLVSPKGSLAQPDFLVIQNGALSWWESKYRSDVLRNPSRRNHPLEVSIIMRHWLDYWEIWTDLNFPFYVVFAVEHQNAVVFANIEELREAITRTDERPNENTGGTVYFNFQKLHHLMPFSDYIKL